MRSEKISKELEQYLIKHIDNEYALDLLKHYSYISVVLELAYWPVELWFTVLSNLRDSKPQTSYEGFILNGLYLIDEANGDSDLYKELKKILDIYWEKNQKYINDKSLHKWLDRVDLSDL